ncbi:MAG: AMP-binding protein [Methyloligellaceae bacterium]
MSETESVEISPAEHSGGDRDRDGLMGLFAHAFEKAAETPIVKDNPIQRRQFGLIGDSQLSFADLCVKVSHISDYVKSVGLKSGDTLLCQLPSTVENIVIILGALKAGLNVAPVPLWWRHGDLDPWITTLQPQALLTLGKTHLQNHSHRLCQLAVDHMSIRFIFGLGEELADGISPLEPVLDGAYPANAMHAEDLSDDIPEFGHIIFAGSKGQPVFHGISQLMATAAMHRDILDLGPQDALLSCFPLSGLSGFGGMLFPWLASGATLHLHHPFDLDDFVANLGEQKISYTSLPPHLGENLLKRYGQGRELKHLRKLGFLYHPHQIEASANIPIVSGMEQFNILNLNEWALPICRNCRKETGSGEPPGDVLGPILFNPIKSVGSSLFECRLKGRYRQSHQSSEANLKGQPIVRGESVGLTRIAAVAEVNNRDEDATFPWTDTDLTCVPSEYSDHEISFLSPDDVMVTGSVFFEADELDSLYQSYPGFADIAVFSRIDPVFGQKLYAAYVPAEGCQPRIDEFINFMYARDVSALKLPNDIFAVKQVPRCSGGQVDRAALSKLFEDQRIF